LLSIEKQYLEKNSAAFMEAGVWSGLGAGEKNSLKVIASEKRETFSHAK
jgi:hypothetical protein